MVRQTLFSIPLLSLAGMAYASEHRLVNSRDRVNAHAGKSIVRRAKTYNMTDNYFGNKFFELVSHLYFLDPLILTHRLAEDGTFSTKLIQPTETSTFSIARMRLPRVSLSLSPMVLLS